MNRANRLAQRTQNALTERGWSLRRAEQETGVNYSTIYNMRLGRSVGEEHLVRFAQAIGEDPNDWLEAGEKPYRLPPSDTTLPSVLVTPMEANLRLAVVGRIAAGTPVLAERNIEEFVSVPLRWVPRGEDPAHCYALTVRGDSMVGADIHDGDVLAVRMAETAEDGQVVVARIGEEVTVKRLRYRYELEEGRAVPYLVSDPETYMDPIRLGADAAVIGLPVGYLRQKPAAWG